MPTMEASAGTVLEHAVVDAQVASGLPVIFVGLVRFEVLRISRLHGNRTESLRGLALTPDIGLGGKALTVGRPVSVRDYAHARAITHEYDNAVAREGLRAMVAVPVRVRGSIKAVLYGGTRTPGELGDRATSHLVKAGEWLGGALETATHPSPPDVVQPGSPLTANREDLLEAVEQIIDDLAPRAATPCCREAAQVCGTLLDVLRGRVAPARTPLLSDREVAVLRLAALGCSDLDIAGNLELDVVAVRTAMRGLRRVFGVHSRHGAVSAARSAGVLA